MYDTLFERPLTQSQRRCRNAISMHFRHIFNAYEIILTHYSAVFLSTKCIQDPTLDRVDPIVREVRDERDLLHHRLVFFSLDVFLCLQTAQ